MENFNIVELEQRLELCQWGFISNDPNDHCQEV
jgi:hypothetical protein